MRFPGFLAAAAALWLLAGCGGDGDNLPRVAVSGKVTLDGKPLPEGAIQFQPAGGAAAGQTPVAGGDVIKDGAYAIPREQGLTPGKYLVSITSAAGGEVQPDDAGPGPAAEPAEERVPEKYNRMSTLTAEVKSGGSNTFDFDLTSK